MKQALIEALKEALRVVLIAVLPIIISGLENGSIEPKLVVVTAIIALLRFIDKALHEVGKSLENENMIKGITRF